MLREVAYTIIDADVYTAIDTDSLHDSVSNTTGCPRFTNLWPRSFQRACPAEAYGMFTMPELSINDSLNNIQGSKGTISSAEKTLRNPFTWKLPIATRVSRPDVRGNALSQTA